MPACRTGDALNEETAERIGCMVGSGIGGLPMIEHTDGEYRERGPRRISPFFVPASIINMISGHLSIKYGFTGPNLAIVTACTTGLHCIGEAGRLIEYGDADVMVAGGAESTVSPLGVGGFAAARALSTRNDDPKTASRPWDKDRDGFVLGEGAGVLVLEEYEHARRRGAKIYAELAGFGMGADAFHMTAPNVDGPKRSMKAALRNAGVNADQVQYLNAHGTSTPLGDVNETNAIKLAFGEHAKKMVVNSTKSMTGHLLGGAGGIESVFTVLALHHQVSPPTINIFNQDPRVRPGLLRQHGARDEDRRGGEEQLRLRRHQRHAGLPPRLTPPARRACASPLLSRPCPAAPGRGGRSSWPCTQQRRGRRRLGCGHAVGARRGVRWRLACWPACRLAAGRGARCRRALHATGLGRQRLAVATAGCRRPRRPGGADARPGRTGCWCASARPAQAGWRGVWLPLSRRDAAAAWPALRVALHRAAAGNGAA